MYITTQTIINLAALITALGVIGTAVFAVLKWLGRQKQQDEDIKDIKEEQCVLSYAMLACLDGLQQLKCNGAVTEAHNKLEKYLNKKAHD